MRPSGRKATLTCSPASGPSQTSYTATTKAVEILPVLYAALRFLSLSSSSYSSHGPLFSTKEVVITEYGAPLPLLPRRRRSWTRTRTRHSDVVCRHPASSMDMIPMITKPDRSAMDGVRKLSHDLLIDNEVKRYKEQSSSIHYFQQRLDLERMVRPALAMGL